MMLVKILEFGSNWWARFGRDPHDRYRYTRHAAYFNSTGVRCGSKMRRCWIVPGLIRFNGVGDFNPQFPNRAVGRCLNAPILSLPAAGIGCCFDGKPDDRAGPITSFWWYRATGSAPLASKLPTGNQSL